MTARPSSERDCITGRAWGDLAAGPRRHISLSQARRALLSNPSSSGDPLVTSPALPGGAGLMALLYGSRVHPVLHIWVSWTLNFSAFMRKVVVLTAHLCNAAFEVLLSTLFWTYLARADLRMLDPCHLALDWQSIHCHLAGNPPIERGPAPSQSHIAGELGKVDAAGQQHRLA